MLTRETFSTSIIMLLIDLVGGRTAWSPTVTIPSANSSSQQTVQARYWYDGQYVHNAKEDAAEVALRILMGSPSTSPVHSSGSGSSSSAGWNRDNGGASHSSPTVQHANTVGVGAAWPRSPPAGRW